MKPETKNDCAGEGQEQFAGAAFRLFIIIVWLFFSVSIEGRK
jgi:hypothetical protein